MRRCTFLSLFFLTFSVASLNAQLTQVSGRVTDRVGVPIEGARVTEKGTANFTLTTRDGRYALRVLDASVLVVSAYGYRDEEVAVTAATHDVTLTQGMLLNALDVVGSRRSDRAPTNTAVPVDIIDLKSVAQTSGQLDLNQLLQYAAPSFNANRQSGADGADHIDPASLRGLGPDQTLVLVNGQRRHQSSLINIFGSRGRGNTGTDLNAIPVSAIERIEILRDGASAQYGSDAIAGVINIVLKSSVADLTAELSSGFHNAAPPARYAVTSTGTDGAELRLGANHGIPLKQSGYLNWTAELLTKGRTNRPVDPAKFDIYRRQYGDAELTNVGVFVNSLLPIGEHKALYAFGGLNQRETDAYAWTREPDSERNVPAIYPDGFDPHIVSSIRDLSLSTGLRGSVRGWRYDLNSTSGNNRFEYGVEGSLNASRGAQSQRDFDAGGFSLFQNTTGLYLNRLVTRSLHVALGAQYRYEKYGIFAGEEASYRNYGNGAPAGSQGFPGFQPADEIDVGRSSFGAYSDIELDATSSITLGAAGRFEHYDDFGSTVTAKLNGRVALSDAIAVRASAGTGFRAPSLAQIHFNSTFTDVVSGEFMDKVIARNNSEVARALGIPPLTEEKSRSAALGLTARKGEFSATIDGYIVHVDDRIVLTGAFAQDDPDIGDELRRLNVAAAQFFTNALDMNTKGLDIVVAHQLYLGEQRLRWSVAANFNDIEIGEIHTNAKLRGKEETYFGPREQAFLVAAAPGSKIGLTLDHNYRRLDTQLRITNFGHVSLIDFLGTRDHYEAKAVTDVSIGYRLNDRLSVTVGGANIFNVYPTAQDTETETGGLWDAVQMGFSGAFYFARVGLRL